MCIKFIFLYIHTYNSYEKRKRGTFFRFLLQKLYEKEKMELKSHESTERTPLMRERERERENLITLVWQWIPICVWQFFVSQFSIVGFGKVVKKMGGRPFTVFQYMGAFQNYTYIYIEREISPILIARS